MADPADLPAYTVRRSSRARRVRLTVSEDGAAVVVLPARAPLRAAALFVEEHADWLRRHIARRTAERSRLDARPALGEGRILEVGGTRYRVAEVDGRSARPARGRVEPVDGTLIVRLGHDGRPARQLLEAWLRAEARAALASRIADHAPRLGVRVTRLTVRDQRSRWGSATRHGSLSFSWRLVLAPGEVLDAVVVHELAHLRILGHSPAFWSLVRAHAPGTDEARRWLRRHGRELRAALD